MNKTISESLDPKTQDLEAPWTDVEFHLVEAEHDVDTCRKVGMYVSFADIGLSDEIIAPDGKVQRQMFVNTAEKVSQSLGNHGLAKAKERH